MNKIGHNSDAFLDHDDVEAAPAPDDADLKKVALLAQTQLDIQGEIAELEEALKVKQAQLKAVREGSLPLAMVTLGMTGFDLVGGGHVEIRNAVGGHISKENKDRALACLEALGQGDLIKRTIVISFGKGEDKWAEKFIRDLNQRKKKVDADITKSVNHNTLGAFIREQFKAAKADGEPVQSTRLPGEAYTLLGVYDFKYAEVELPR